MQVAPQIRNKTGVDGRDASYANAGSATRALASGRSTPRGEGKASARPKRQTTWHKYLAYGLGIHSELPLPELMASDKAKCDVVIRLGRIAHRLGGGDRTYTYFQLAADEALLQWDLVGSFIARSGREIVVEPAPGVAPQDVRRVLEGVVLGAVAHQRGLLALHASAVVRGGEVVGFLAATREGRFAMAAALYARGHALLADDLLVLASSTTARVAVLPGFPQTRMRPAAPVAGTAARRAPGHVRLSLPLRCLYVMRRGLAPAVAKLSPREALVAVISNSYAARMFPQSLSGVKASAHLVRCAALVDRVRVYGLPEPTSLAVLARSVQLVEDHLAGRSESAATTGVAAWTPRS